MGQLMATFPGMPFVACTGPVPPCGEDGELSVDPRYQNNATQATGPPLDQVGPLRDQSRLLRVLAHQLT